MQRAAYLGGRRASREPSLPDIDPTSVPWEASSSPRPGCGLPLPATRGLLDFDKGAGAGGEGDLGAPRGWPGCDAGAGGGECIGAADTEPTADVGNAGFVQIFFFGVGVFGAGPRRSSASTAPPALKGGGVARLTASQAFLGVTAVDTVSLAALVAALPSPQPLVGLVRG